MEKLLTVEEAFAEARGVTLSPKITVARAYPATFAVSLRLPSGEERAATASMQVAHIRGPHGAFAMVKLAVVRPEDVPPGTEVWTAA